MSHLLLSSLSVTPYLRERDLSNSGILALVPVELARITGTTHANNSIGWTISNGKFVRLLRGRSSILLVAEGFNGIELRGFHGGPNAKDKADAHAHDDAGGCSPDRHAAGPL